MCKALDRRTGRVVALKRVPDALQTVDAARRAGTFTPEWVVGHILHEVAAHTGQLQVTRDVLLSRGRSR